MKYSIKGTAQNIKGIKLAPTFEIIGYNNRELFVNKLKIAENVDTTSGSLSVFNDFLFFDKNGSACCFNLLSKELFETNQYRGYNKSLEGDTFICVYDEIYSGNIFTWRTGLFNFNRQQLIKEYQFLQNVSIAHFLNSESVITYLRPIGLGKVSLLTGLYEWEADLSNYCIFEHFKEIKQGHISEIIGIYDEKLWVMCAYRRLLGISLVTGEVIGNILLEDLRPGLRLNAKSPYLDESTGEMCFFDYQYYFKINLKTDKLSLFEKLSFLGQADNLQTKTFKDNYVYFTAGMQYSSENLRDDGYTGGIFVGVYNQETLSLEWLQDLVLLGLKEETVNQAPQVTETNIYVLDTGGTLYIFEREN